MDYKILFTSKASNDLRNILIYIAETNSINVAFDYIDKIENRINQLKQFPNLGKISLIRYLRIKQMRVLTVESHFIYYKVFEKDKTIRIYAIKHTRQSQKIFNIRSLSDIWNASPKLSKFLGAVHIKDKAFYIIPPTLTK